MNAAPFLRRVDGGVIRAVGKDALELLHRISTNAVLGLAPGEVRETILTTDRARIIDVLFVLAFDESVVLLTSAARTADVLAWLDRYTIMEDVRYQDETAQWEQWEIGGDGAVKAATRALGAEMPAWSHTTQPSGLLALRHESFRGPGIRVLCPAHGHDTTAGAFQDAAARAGCGAISDSEYHAWRVTRGYPAVGRELTERVNPLESGASTAVSFTKGCYIGQEVIARLDTYNKVQRHLRRLLFQTVLPHDPEPGVPLLSGAADAGFLTSLASDAARGVSVGLGCIRLAYEAAGTDLTLHLGDNDYHATILE